MSIKTFRLRAGETQQQLADALGITDSAVNQWEKGKTFPNIHNLRKLAEHYNCTFDDILEGEE